MINTKKLSIASLLVALGVVLSGLHIPVGVAKVFPVQHMVNILGAVILGPAYAVLMAFATSTIRVLTGMGSLLAFPGSMIGAFLAGIFYKKWKNIGAAFIGEIVGTGVIGAMVAYPVAAFLLSKEAALFTYVIPFSMSSCVGALIGLVIVMSLRKTKIFEMKTDKEE